MAVTNTDSFSQMADDVAGTSPVASFAVVVLAAGSGTRLGYGIPKAAVQHSGKTLLEWALAGVDASGVASRIVVTVPKGDTALTKIVANYGALTVSGGSSRAESVALALSALDNAPVRSGFSSDAPSHVLIHDAARSFTPVEVFHRVCQSLSSGQAAVIPVLPVVDTIKTVDTDGYVRSTVQRSVLRSVQTPQGFHLKTLLEAYRQTEQQGLNDEITDDASVAEMCGIPVKTVLGDFRSLKITVAEDLALASALKLADELSAVSEKD